MRLGELLRLHLKELNLNITTRQLHSRLNPGKPRALYTCTLYDEATGSCADYANRPRMCRAYPYASEEDGRCSEYKDRCTRRGYYVNVQEDIEVPA